MKRAPIMFIGILAAMNSEAQTPRPERLETCADAVLVTGETYQFATGPSGHGGSVDWIHCATARVVYTLGGASYSIADSRWSFGKGAISIKALDNLWLSGDVADGSGHAPTGAFDYLTFREGLTWRAFDRVYAKFEHQYLRIAGDHGNVYKLAAVFQPLPPLLLEIGGAHSGGGNLGTRSWTGRVDWVDARGRAYAGYSQGRTTPQIVDIVSGTRLPDTKSHQSFAGVFVPVHDGEVGASFDEIRTPSSRRRTFGVNLRWPLQ
jgi:hypothetical protein